MEFWDSFSKLLLGPVKMETTNIFDAYIKNSEAPQENDVIVGTPKEKGGLVDGLESLEAEANSRNPNYEYLKLEILELRELLQEVASKYRLADDKRKVMERRNSILISDNLKLKQQCSEAEEKRILAEKEVAEMQVKLDKLSGFLLVPDKREVKGDIRKTAGLRERSTSCSDLIEAIGGPLKKDTIKKKVKEQAGHVLMTRAELGRLESELERLKGALERREEAWSKTGERERLQRLRLARLNTSLHNLRSENSWKSQELDAKARQLKCKIQELVHANKEIQKLKVMLRNVPSINSKKRLGPILHKQRHPVTSPKTEFRRLQASAVKQSSTSSEFSPQSQTPPS